MVQARLPYLLLVNQPGNKFLIKQLTNTNWSRIDCRSRSKVYQLHQSTVSWLLRYKFAPLDICPLRLNDVGLCRIMVQSLFCLFSK